MTIAAPTTAPAATTPTRTTRSLPVVTVAAAAGGAAVATAGAAVLHAAGLTLGAGGEIPLSGFASVTFVGGVLGGLLLAAVRRRSDRPRHRFFQLTAALTVLSCAAPVAIADSVGDGAGLIALHLVAAATIVPVLARRATR